MAHRALRISLSIITGILLGLFASVAGAGEQAAFSRVDARCLRLDNDYVAVIVHEEDGTWDAAWDVGHPDIASIIGQIRFTAIISGHALALGKCKVEDAPFDDALGKGRELVRRWTADGFEVEQRIRVFDGRRDIAVFGRITNRTGKTATLGEIRLIDSVSPAGKCWWVAGSYKTPAAVAYPYATPACRPAPEGDAEQTYQSGGLLAFSPPKSNTAMAVGMLSAEGGVPEITAKFLPGKGGASLRAGFDYHARPLADGETLVLDPVWLSAEDRFLALEHYGDAVAALAPKPLRTATNALWCSWYPIRMTLSEEITLANARIAAEHFKPLGMDVIQLDHGWQRGDICGDWVVNERFPHGLKWLADELRTKYGMKLGLWVAPTQVAETSQLFREHPEYLKLDAAGKPALYGNWFWKPNPRMARLDVGRPGAEQWLEETFARLSAEGAAYYKIDFISGTPSLHRAMKAIRRGAGESAWIRFCQTPPLLSAGVASSAYIGDDTGDAGIGYWMDVMRKNAPLLAASYWVNGRLYQREICDMSVGLKAPVEEARFRMTIMTLGGCSISFSDDFRDLDLPRIRMMQKCLPPGNPPARPLDLYERALPSVWHMRCKNDAGEWDALGLLNFEDQPREIAVDLAALGYPADAEVLAFEFWEDKFLGPQRGRIALTLAPRTARILLVRPKPDRPQLLATDMHLLGGWHEVERMNWNPQELVLSGRYRRAAGLEGKAFFYVPDSYRPLVDSPAAKGNVRLTPLDKNLLLQEVRFDQSERDWAIPFERTK
jgi:hypothetical protein